MQGLPDLRRAPAVTGPRALAAVDRVAVPVPQFTKSFAENAAAVKIGKNLAPDTQMGPLVNSRGPDGLEIWVVGPISTEIIKRAGGRNLAQAVGRSCHGMGDR